jgi:hypothetical protein
VIYWTFRTSTAAAQFSYALIWKGCIEKQGAYKVNVNVTMVRGVCLDLALAVLYRNFLVADLDAVKNTVKTE